MKILSTLGVAIALGAAACGAAAQDHAHGSEHAFAPAELADGEVRKIDREAGKITLRHGELKNLQMPAMSMVFRVKDAAMLDQVEVGSKVKFAADRLDGAITIVELRPVE